MVLTGADVAIVVVVVVVVLVVLVLDAAVVVLLSLLLLLVVVVGLCVALAFTSLFLCFGKGFSFPCFPKTLFFLPPLCGRLIMTVAHAQIH